MRSTILLAAAFCMLSPGAAARGLEREAYSMEILVDGRPLEEYHARGTVYVEALKGREYSVRLHNHTGRRVAVALSVDGLNSIDAKTTSARDARKWVLDPYQTIVLGGWQTGSSTARRFYFTTEERSYGGWLGRTDNLGIVSAAFFREAQSVAHDLIQRQKRSGRREGRSAPSEREAARDSAAAPPQAESEAPRPDDDFAATGIGREVEHRVRRVHFDAETKPAAVIDLRYEYRDALVRLGVLPPIEEPLARRERSRGFEDTGFAPDPFRQ